MSVVQYIFFSIIAAAAETENRSKSESDLNPRLRIPVRNREIGAQHFSFNWRFSSGKGIEMGGSTVASLRGHSAPTPWIVKLCTFSAPSDRDPSMSIWIH